MVKASSNMSRRPEDGEVMASTPRKRFVGPVTLRSGSTRTLEGKTYVSGKDYDGEDPVIQRNSLFFVRSRPKPTEKKATLSTGETVPPPSELE